MIREMLAHRATPYGLVGAIVAGIGIIIAGAVAHTVAIQAGICSVGSVVTVAGVFFTIVKIDYNRRGERFQREQRDEALYFPNVRDVKTWEHLRKINPGMVASPNAKNNDPNAKRNVTIDNLYRRDRATEDNYSTRGTNL
jgi:hypothetical protein